MIDLYKIHLNKPSMKTSLIILCSVLLIFSCQPKTEKINSINGVYKMDNQFAYAIDNDSLLSSLENPNQIKIYTDNHFIWINIGKDSVANFGVGSYKLTDNAITETNIYNSGGVDTPDQFNLNVEPTELGYKQVIPSMDYNNTKIKLEEKYTRLKEDSTGSFDGLWKATNNYFVKGTDTTRSNYPDYKIFNKGNFSWAVRALMDTAQNKFVSYVGSGTFSIAGDQLKENTGNTNISTLGSNVIEGTIINSSAQEFTQAIKQADGSIRYTTYTKVQ